ncbi:hypothetical protein V5799_008714 [Amblyomma americanum]|uniref:Uncharacterized protein n=1 Tax=Amblyomma americanum TaxID=6943 RepID=A0AAQ4FCM3_AMBAM
MSAVSAVYGGSNRHRLKLEAARKTLLLDEGFSRSPKNVAKASPRYDLRRRVLETNLMRESGVSNKGTAKPDLVLSSAPKASKPTLATPPVSFRPWAKRGGSPATGFPKVATRKLASGVQVRVATLQTSPAKSPLVALRCAMTPRKLGSPRNCAVVSAAAIKRRLRRSWSYREAIAGDPPSSDPQETQASKRQKTGATSPDRGVVTETKVTQSKRPCRVQHGKPFAIPIPPAITPLTTLPRLLAGPDAVTPRGFVTSPAQNLGPASIAPTLTTKLSTGPLVDHRPTWVLTPFSQNGQSGSLSPLVTSGYQNLAGCMLSSPSLVSQGTQTSPKSKLRRRSSLKRALERLLNTGKENEVNASEGSAPKDEKTKVKRRPSFVESLLFRRSCSDDVKQDKCTEHSSDHPQMPKSTAGSTPPSRKKPRRARSLQLKPPALDPWG